MTLSDIAREAGVSLATVDRVLHNRPRVREDTALRVMEAMQRHGLRPHADAAELARRKPRRFVFVMPVGPNLFMQQILDYLGEMSDWMAARRIAIEIVATDVFDPEALANTLETLAPDIDGVAVVAVDHPRVRVAIDDLVGSGKAVVTLVSDVPASQRQFYVGIDNIAAGRTAGALVGRLVGQRVGRIAVVAGSANLRDHAERIFGFRQVMSAEFSQLEMLPVVEGRDDDERSESLTRLMFSEHEDIIGLYNVGAGTPGVSKALIGCRPRRPGGVCRTRSHRPDPPATHSRRDGRRHLAKPRPRGALRSARAARAGARRADPERAGEDRDRHHHAGQYALAVSTRRKDKEGDPR